MCVLTMRGLSSWTAVPLDGSFCLRQLKRCLLMIEDSRRWNEAAVKRGHRVQFTVKMLSLNVDGGAELVPLGA